MKVNYVRTKRAGRQVWKWVVFSRRVRMAASPVLYTSRSNAKRAYRHLWYNMPFGGK